MERGWLGGTSAPGSSTPLMTAGAGTGPLRWLPSTGQQFPGFLTRSPRRPERSRHPPYRDEPGRHGYRHSPRSHVQVHPRTPNSFLEALAHRAGWHEHRHRAVITGDIASWSTQRSGSPGLGHVELLRRQLGGPVEHPELGGLPADVDAEQRVPGTRPTTGDSEEGTTMHTPLEALDGHRRVGIPRRAGQDALPLAHDGLRPCRPPRRQAPAVPLGGRRRVGRRPRPGVPVTRPPLPLGTWGVIRRTQLGRLVGGLTRCSGTSTGAPDVSSGRPEPAAGRAKGRSRPTC